MENFTFKTVSTEDGRIYRIHATFSANSVEVLLLQDGNAWRCLVDSKTLEKFMKHHNLNWDTYRTKFLEYIQNTPKDIVFMLTKEEFSIVRLLDSKPNKQKVKFFASNLEEVNYVTCVEKLLDDVFSKYSLNLERLSSLHEEAERLKIGKTDCEKQLKELIESKKTSEDELYGSFVLILNEKKRRIQHLTEQLQAIKNGRSSTNPPVVVKSRKRKLPAGDEMLKVEKREVISESEESSGSYKTDEEIIPETQNDNHVECQPSTSKVDILPEKYIIPKRVKPNKNTCDVLQTIVAPKESPPAQPPVEDIEEKVDSQTIDFNTQQLLDDL